MSHAHDEGLPEEEGPPDEVEGVVVPDDPSAITDGAVGEPPAEQSAGAAQAAPDLETQLAERTADLQRLQAEFLNYKRRVDRDRDLVRQNATYAALAPITEVLDTIDRAREHGPLDDGLKAVAEQLERVVAGLGLVKFGTPGDPFDPTVHEALSHVGQDPDVSVTTCKVIAKSGYKIGDRVVRAAQVLVVDPGVQSEKPPSSDADHAAGDATDGLDHTETKGAAQDD